MSALASKPLVAIIWQDAHGKATGDLSEDAIRQEFHAPAMYTSFGLLIVDDERGYTIAMEESDTGFRGLTFVPRGMVDRVIKLGVPREKQRRKRVRGKSEGHQPEGRDRIGQATPTPVA